MLVQVKHYKAVASVHYHETQVRLLFAQTRDRGGLYLNTVL